MLKTITPGTYWHSLWLKEVQWHPVRNLHNSLTLGSMQGAGSWIDLFFFTFLLTSVFGKISQTIVVHSKLNPEGRHWSSGGLLCKAHTYVEMSYVANETEQAKDLLGLWKQRNLFRAPTETPKSQQFGSHTFSFFLFGMCLCAWWACVCTRTCCSAVLLERVWLHVHMCVCTWRSTRLTSGVMLDCTPHYLVRKDFSTEPRVCHFS